MMYTWFEIFLQILGSALIGVSTWARNWDKHHMLLSCWCSVLGGLVITVYSILTHQWGFLPLNIYTVIMGAKGIKTWKVTRKNKLRLKRVYDSEHK